MALLISSAFHKCLCCKTNPTLTLRYLTSKSFWYSKCLMHFLSWAVRTSLSNHLQLPSSDASCYRKLKVLAVLWGRWKAEASREGTRGFQFTLGLLTENFLTQLMRLNPKSWKLDLSCKIKIR